MNKGSNVSIVLIDSFSSLDADGKPVAPFRGGVLVIPVKKKGTDAAVPMVVFGIAVRESVKAEDGSAIEAQIKYDRGATTKSKVEAKVYSGAKPEFFRIYRVD